MVDEGGSLPPKKLIKMFVLVIKIAKIKKQHVKNKYMIRVFLLNNKLKMQF